MRRQTFERCINVAKKGKERFVSNERIKQDSLCDKGDSNMPAYFMVEFSFYRTAIHSNFVSDIYQIFFQHGMEFKRGFWHGENMTLNEIIAWNQKRVEAGFEFGLEEDVKLDYRQILLLHPAYSEMRLLLTCSGQEVRLSLLVPESDLIIGDEEYRFIGSKLRPLLELACAVWAGGKPALVQSCLELEGGISLKQAEAGRTPCVDPFAMIAPPLLQEAMDLDGLQRHRLPDGGWLLQDESLIEAKIQAVG